MISRRSAVLACGCILFAGIIAGCATPEAEPTEVPPTLTALLVSVTSVVTEEPLDGPSTELVRDIPYVGAQAVDVYYPTQPGPWPVIVILHGAGGNKTQYALGAEALAAKGAVVFAANWRSEPWIHGEMALMEDTACAVRFARSTAPDYGGDPSHVVLFAHSVAGWSGATIALAGDDFVGNCPFDDVSAVPNSLVGYAGAYDAGESNPDGGASFLKEQNPELWDLIYPYAHIGSNLDTAFRLVAGDQDQHDVEVAERFLSALQAAGYEAEIVILEGVGHDGPAPGTPQFETLFTVILDASNVDRPSRTARGR